MREFLIVGCGGFCGAGLRYFVGILAARYTASYTAAWGAHLGTLAVNVLGCFLIGLLTGLAEGRELLTPAARLFVVVGLLGGFTTFSAFGLESFHLARGSQWLSVALHAGAHLMLGLIAVAFGFWLGAR